MFTITISIGLVKIMFKIILFICFNVWVNVVTFDVFFIPGV